MAVRIDPDGAEIKAIRNVVDMHGKVVLEVGCGDGWLAEALANEAKRYVAIDTDEKAIEKARRRNTPAEFRIQDLFDVEEHFDVVIAVRTIHEIPPESQELALKKLLDTGDIVVLLEPIPGGEIQSLYDICLLQKNIDHKVRVSSFYTTLYQLLEREEAKPKNIDLVRAPWQADGPEELARFIVEDEKTPEVLEQVTRRAQRYWNKHPGAIYDESILVLIEKT